MLDWVFITGLVILILGFFYKQSAVHEFRINQGEMSSKDTLHELWEERVPLVIRGLPRLSLWTHDDVIERPCYEKVSLFQDQTLAGWIQGVGRGGASGAASAEEGEQTLICPWQGREDQAKTLARVSGIPLWCKTHLHPLLGKGWRLRWIQYYAWAGSVGLRRLYASWTCILPAEGEILVTIFPETMEPYLPPEAHGTFPSTWTRRDTPFVGDIKYMVVVVRAGTCLFLPPHWYVSWVGKEGHPLPMVFTVSYHSPISWVAEKIGSRGGRGDKRA